MKNNNLSYANRKNGNFMGDIYKFKIVKKYTKPVYCKKFGKTFELY